MKRVTRLLFALLVAVLPLQLVVADGVKLPPFERVKLANGTVLLLMERHDVPLIEFNAIVRGGAVSDPAGGSGTASLVAGLLEKGAGKRDANEFAQTVASVGGSVQAGAGLEQISVSGSFLARDQNLMVELLADMLQRPRLDAEQFDSLRSRRIEFLREAKSSQLSQFVSLYGAAALFGSHPYGRPAGGSEASLAALKYADIKNYHANYFGSDRLIIAVAGDFKAGQMKQLLSRAFANWRAASGALPAIPQVKPVNGRHVVLVDAPDATQSYFWAANLGVAMNDSRRAALDIVNTAFGGRFTSMLNTELRIRTGLSYSAGSRLNRNAVLGDWRMSSFTRTAATIEAIDLAFTTLDKLHADGLDAAQLDSAKNYVRGQYPLTLETSAQWADELATMEFYGLSRSYVEAYLDSFAGVSREVAANAISTVVPSSKNLVLVVIGKAADVREGLRKYGPITEMKLSDPQFQKP